MVTKFRGDFVTNGSHCKLFVLSYSIDGSITSLTTNHATNDDFLYKCTFREVLLNLSLGHFLLHEMCDSYYKKVAK